MRHLKTIISTICAILIIFCSIAQFHHHTHDGDMVIFSCNEQILCNLEHSFNHQNHTNHNKCSHDCHDGHHQDEKNCSLKINILTPEKKQISKIIIACMIIADFDLNISNIIHSLLINKDVEISSFKIYTTFGLRAPPIC